MTDISEELMIPFTYPLQSWVTELGSKSKLPINNNKKGYIQKGPL